MQIEFNINNFARVCHSLAACQRHTPPSLAAVIGLSNNDVISLRSLRCVRCVRWLETPLQLLLQALADGAQRFRSFVHIDEVRIRQIPETRTALSDIN